MRTRNLYLKKPYINLTIASLTFKNNLSYYLQLYSSSSLTIHTYYNHYYFLLTMSQENKSKRHRKKRQYMGITDQQKDSNTKTSQQQNIGSLRPSNQEQSDNFQLIEGNNNFKLPSQNQNITNQDLIKQQVKTYQKTKQFKKDTEIYQKNRMYYGQDKQENDFSKIIGIESNQNKDHSENSNNEADSNYSLIKKQQETKDIEQVVKITSAIEKKSFVRRKQKRDIMTDFDQNKQFEEKQKKEIVQTPPIEEPKVEEPKIQKPQTQEQSKQQEQEIIEVNDPNSKTLTEILDSCINLKGFLLNPLPQGKIMKCFLRKYNQKFTTKFQLFLEDTRSLMAAQTQSGTIGCNYHISQNKEMDKNSQFYLGKVRSNFTGSSYSIYTHGQNPKGCSNKQKWRSTVGNIQYQANFMGIKGPRKLTVQIPDLQSKHNPQIFKIDQKKTLEQLTLQYPGCIRKFKNKEPRWNEKLKSYALNFGGRVKMASIKNFILQDILNPEKNLLVFGKVDDRTFSLDFWYPFSPFQAFGIVLTCFDYKLTCQ